MSDLISSQLKKGVLDLCVLALLSRQPAHGYEIARQLAVAIDMGEGTIYPLMRRLQTDGLVDSYLEESPNGPPRKVYRITERGKESLQTQRREWQQFSNAVNNFFANHD